MPDDPYEKLPLGDPRAVNCGHPAGCRCEDLPLKRLGCGDSTMALCRASRRVREGRWVRGAPSHVFADLLRELRADGIVLARVGDLVPERADFGQHFFPTRAAPDAVCGELSPEASCRCHLPVGHTGAHEGRRGPHALSSWASGS